MDCHFHFTSRIRQTDRLLYEKRTFDQMVTGAMKEKMAEGEG